MPDAQFALEEHVPLQELTQADGIGVGVAVSSGVSVGVAVGVGVGVGVEQIQVVLDSHVAFLQ